MSLNRVEARKFIRIKGWHQFNVGHAENYGCAGQGFFDAYSKTFGHPVDKYDDAFHQWKQCVQCVAPSPEEILPYDYDRATNSCGKISQFK